MEWHIRNNGSEWRSMAIIKHTVHKYERKWARIDYGTVPLPLESILAVGKEVAFLVFTLLLFADCCASDGCPVEL